MDSVGIEKFLISIEINTNGRRGQSYYTTPSKQPMLKS
jgi:hypothetical protein